MGIGNTLLEQTAFQKEAKSLKVYSFPFQEYAHVPQRKKGKEKQSNYSPQKMPLNETGSKYPKT